MAFSVERGSAVATAATVVAVATVVVAATFEPNNLLIDPYTRRSTSLSGVASA